MSFYRSATIALLAAVGSITATASAQHANFTLFDVSEGRMGIYFGPRNHQFVAPITNPSLNEDAFITSDIRINYSYYKIDADGTFAGGEIQSWSVQGRVALNDQFQVLLYNFGYLDINADVNGGFSDDGAMDPGIGLKWKFLSDWNSQLHMAVGIGYEAALGSSGVLQNDDASRFWYSVEKGFGSLHLGATVNYVYAWGKESEFLGGNSDVVSWHVHLDYYVNPYFSPVVELNGLHRVNGSELFGDSGADLFNLAGGTDFYTVAAGLEYRPIETLGVRGAFELPIDRDGSELYDWRVIVGVNLSF
jgi:hypothetical protein